MYLVFTNPGEIDPTAIKTFGVSVKESENPFGFFGTGLKYAIAIILRRGNFIQISSGQRVYKFGTRKTTVRGTELKTVTMNRKGLGFTTEVGKTWEPWMAYRELRCNTLDEGGRFFLSDTIPEPEAGNTMVVVEDAELLSAHKDSDRYFLESKPRHVAGNLEIHPGPSNQFYFKGVRVAQSKAVMNHTYNLISGIELTEDRTAKSEYRVQHDIASAIAYHCTDPELLDSILLADKDSLEGRFDFTFTCPSQQFAERVGLHLSRLDPRLNQTVIAACNYVKITSQLEDLSDKLDTIDSQRLDQALSFLRDLGLYTDQYPIKVVASLGQSILGRAEDETIFISKYAFDQGTKILAGTIYEEWCHLKHGYSDESRNFQNFLLDRLMSVGERALGRIL